MLTLLIALSLVLLVGLVFALLQHGREHRTPLVTAIAALLIVLITLPPDLALAAAGAPAAGGSTIDQWIGRIVGAVVIALGERLWSWLSEKKAVAKVQKHVDIHALLQQLGHEAIAYAEEQGHKAVKEGKRALSSLEKKNAALGYAMTVAKRLGLQQVAMDEVSKIIEALLGVRRPAKPASSSSAV